MNRRPSSTPSAPEAAKDRRRRRDTAAGRAAAATGRGTDAAATGRGTAPTAGAAPGFTERTAVGRATEPGEAGSRPEGIAPHWFDAVAAHPGAQALAKQWLAIVAWLVALVALAVNAATMSSLYGAFVPLVLVAAVLQSISLPTALGRPRGAITLAVVSLGGTTVLTEGHATLPWPIPVTSLVIAAMLCAILALRERWAYAVTCGLLSVAVPGACAVAIGLITDEWRPISANLLTAASVLALVITFGVLVREALRSRAELLEQQERTAAEQERRQLVEERNRIARELHDIVAHGLSIISIQASTARYRTSGMPAEVAAELDQITELARTALVEMRELLSVLRQAEAEQDLAPQPTLAKLPDLVETVGRSAAVSFTVHGDLQDPAVSDVTAISAYRIVQEALSNAVRHAPGAPIDVEVAIGQNVLMIDVQNPDAALSPPASVDGPRGFGLLGMRERATFIGGMLAAGPLPSGGFSVHAELPLRAASKISPESADDGAHPAE
ncbi:MAG TPA: sensor histidine kinase [Beutenbergiaceae bacterium]|nr:sensor histidine kinase [Beutenbergiaceae bacterium]